MNYTNVSRFAVSNLLQSQSKCTRHHPLTTALTPLLVHNLLYFKLKALFGATKNLIASITKDNSLLTKQNSTYNQNQLTFRSQNKFPLTTRTQHPPLTKLPLTTRTQHPPLTTRTQHTPLTKQNFRSQPKLSTLRSQNKVPLTTKTQRTLSS